MPKFSVSGRIIDRQTRNGVAKLRVETWDKDLVYDDMVGSAVTNEQGSFQMEFDDTYFQTIFGDRRPDLFFKVFRDNQLIKSTEDSVLWNVAAGETTVTIEIDVNRQPQGFSPRVVVKFRDYVEIPYEDGIEQRITRLNLGPCDRLMEKFPDITFKKLFTSPEPEAIRELVNRATQRDRTYRPPNFLTYFAVDCPPGLDLDALAKTLSSWRTVETAYIEEAPPIDAQVFPYDDPFWPSQGYLDPSPDGIDAEFAWEISILFGGFPPGGDGRGLRFADVERGWTLNHEDLTGANINLLSGVNEATSFAHGTSVLGVIAAVDNDLGCIGITPNLDWIGLVSARRTPSSFSTAGAIMSAIPFLNFGDVLLLELGIDLSPIDNNADIAVEIRSPNFEAIRLATALGIIAIEPAGNGDIDLDTYTNSNGERILRRPASDCEELQQKIDDLKAEREILQEELRTAVGSVKSALIALIRELNRQIAELTAEFRMNCLNLEFRDSGAIMVGAATSSFPHRKSSFSCFGSRVDCYAWGGGVATLSSNELGATDLYTNFFGGTSSASAIIAGAALQVQAVAETNLGYRFSPEQLREIFSDPANGTPSENQAIDRIGVMPDLRAIYQNVLGLGLPPDIRVSLDIDSSSTSSVSSSPDIILLPTKLQDPQTSLGEKSGTENSNTLSRAAKAGQDNFIYVRVRNRGGSTAKNVVVTVFWTPVATLVTPNLWNLVGSATIPHVPSGNLLTVSDAIVWSTEAVPATGHYCLVAVIDNKPYSPSKLIDRCTWNNFLRSLREHQNIAWQNFHVVGNEPGEKGQTKYLALPFIAPGAPDIARKMQLEVVGGLPKGVSLMIEMPLYLVDSLEMRSPFVKVDEKRQVGRVPVNPHSRTSFKEVLFPAKSRTELRLLVFIPKELRENCYEIFVRQLYQGEEVGRVTWRLVPQEQLKSNEINL